MGQQKVRDMSEPIDKAEEKKVEEKAAPKVKSKKKKIKRQVSSGRAYIKATYNNTILTFTDAGGDALVQCSAGQVGFRGPKKSTPYAAGIIVSKAAEKVKPYGLKEVNVFVKGVGGGREAAIRALNVNGINVLSIKDITPIPHNGCRPKKPRRV
jgi:small subunit ribosomal protein S11